MINDINHFLQIAKGVMANERAFQMRRRMNPHHPQDVKDEEARLHRSNQQFQWFRLKTYFNENCSHVMAYAEDGDISTEDEKRIIKAIARVIENEITEKILLGIGEDEE